MSLCRRRERRDELQCKYHLTVERLQNVLAVPGSQAIEHFVVVISPASKGTGNVNGGHSRVPGDRPRSEQRAGHDNGPVEQTCNEKVVSNEANGFCDATASDAPLDASETM